MGAAESCPAVPEPGISVETLSATPVLAALLLLPHVLFALRVVGTTYSTWSRVGLHGIYKRVAGAVLTFVSSAVPGVAGLVEGEVKKELAGIERDMLGDGDEKALLKLPTKGLSAEKVVAWLTELKGDDAFTKMEGKQWGGIYHEPGSALTDVQVQAWSKFNTSNALYPQSFPSLRKFEAELVSMTVGLIHGHEVGAVGLLTSGGTESVLIAALAYREQGRARGITHPQIICGISAHPAIVKACHYFGIELLKAPLQAGTYRLDAASVRPLITSRTVAIYASAPSFSFGCVDEIEELGELATSRGIGLHVDNCLGGYLLSFLQKEGLFDRKWDFSVPGVTTVSVDLHKYGFASKGASCVAFRDPKLRALTYVPSADGCEGLYVTPTLQGSRSGATMAAAWATLVHMGEEGYRAAARKMHEATLTLKKELGSVKGLKLAGDPSLAIVPLCGTDGLDVYCLASLLEKKGWGVFTGQKPATVAIPVGERTPHLLPSLIADVKESVTYLLAHPETKPEGTAAVYGAAASIPDNVLESVLRGYIDVKMTVKPKKGGAGAA